MCWIDGPRSNDLAPGCRQAVDSRGAPVARSVFLLDGGDPATVARAPETGADGPDHDDARSPAAPSRLLSWHLAQCDRDPAHPELLERHPYFPNLGFPQKVGEPRG